MRADELTNLREQKPSVDRMTALAALAGEALAAGDIEVGAEAKALEVETALGLGRIQHSVVAGAELISALPAGAIRSLKSRATRRVVDAARIAVDCAMSLPAVPLSTVEDLVRWVEALLAERNVEPLVVLHLEAQLAFIRGDQAGVLSAVSRLAPAINRYSWVVSFTRCPGCEVASLAEWARAESSAGALRQILTPVLVTRTWNDPPAKRAWLEEVGVGDGVCNVSIWRGQLCLARALAKEGSVAEASDAMRDARRVCTAPRDEDLVSFSTGDADIARASKSRDSALRAAEVLERLRPNVEDAHVLVEAGGACVRALTAVQDPARARAIHDLTIDVARALDARLERPRHVVDLASALTTALASPTGMG